MAETPLLKISGLTKVFGGQVALDDLDFSVQPGEVHGLLGENGSGKSTLIKVLSGFHQPDAGTLEVNGVPVDLPLQPGQYRHLGFSFVHQDLGLVAELSAAENLYMGKIAGSHAKYFSWRVARERAQAVFDEYGAAIEANQPVERLRPVQRAMLAIIRALEGLKDRDRAQTGEHRPNLLVLDEPTVFLPRHEVSALFDLVRGIKARGSSVLFVSHDLDEVRHITDSITVLRDGRLSGTIATRDASKSDLVKMIVGHEIERAESSAADQRQESPVVLSVRGLTSRLARDVSFDLHEGEILGLAGLVGSGCEDAVYALFGNDPRAVGSVSIGGTSLDLAKHTTHAAVDVGLALVPADRKRQGSVADMSVADNMNLTVLDRFFSSGRLHHGSMRENAKQLLREFDVRPPIPEMEYGQFSGGNQQKAMLAKWLQTQPRVLLLHEPTQGVDIGAREQIYAQIRGRADTTSVLCASSDYEELATLCHRVAVFVRGSLVGYLTGADVTHSKIANMCMGSDDGDMPVTAAAPSRDVEGRRE